MILNLPAMDYLIQKINIITLTYITTKKYWNLAYFILPSNSSTWLCISRNSSFGVNPQFGGW